MIEVFKTNVTDPYHARKIIGHIHQAFNGYQANFDLDDCDRILRIKCIPGPIHPEPIILLLHRFGFKAEVLADEPLIATSH